jgi:hypothetical protein
MMNFHGGRKLEESEELNDIKYHLQLTTNGNLAFVEFDVWKIENLANSLQFERDYSDCLKVCSWLKSVDLGYDNNIELVSKKGITFPQSSGMKISTGRLELKPIIRNGKPVDMLLIFCDVAVGKALVVDESSLQDPLPDGYDSYYCPSQPLDRDKDGSFSLSEYAAAANFDCRNPM